jgi:very-short-patch-repair endonuclease
MTLDSAQRRIRRTTPELLQRAKMLRQEATVAEQILWEALRGRRCNGLKFRRQHAVGTFILDFWCPEHRLAVEVDGTIHELPEVTERDRDRQAWIQCHGILVLRVKNDEVESCLESVLERIKEAASR